MAEKKSNVRENCVPMRTEGEKWKIRMEEFKVKNTGVYCKKRGLWRGEIKKWREGRELRKRKAREGGKKGKRRKMKETRSRKEERDNDEIKTGKGK